MSRGPGWIERAIAAYFEAKPSSTFSTDELVRLIYRVDKPKKAQRVAVLRAADKVIKRMPWWAKWKVERTFRATMQGVGAIFVNLTDVRSYGLGRLRADFCHAKHTTTQLEAMLNDENAKYEGQLIVRGGAWWLHVQKKRQELLGETLDDETQARIEASKEEWKQFEAATIAVFGGKPEEKERRSRAREANAHGHSCGRCSNPIAPSAPIVRDRQRMKSMAGRGSEIVVKCVECAEKLGPLKEVFDEHICATCGRKVYEFWRQDRVRTFCSNECRRRGKYK
jgi:hypothetical protein